MNPFTLTIAGAGNTALGGIISNGGTTGTTSLTKNGSGTLTLSGANTYTGVTTLNAGTLTATRTSGTPLGNGGITLNGGILNVAPATVTASTDIALTNAGALTISGGASFTLARGGNRSVTFTSTNQFTRTNNGTIVITPTAIANLGATTTAGGERLLITGTPPVANSNNPNLLFIPVVAQTSNAGGTTGTAGDFVKYNVTNGFTSAAANYTTFLGTAPSTVTGAIWNITGSASVTGTVNKDIGAIRVGAFTLTIGTGTTAEILSVGNSATSTAQIILNGGTITTSGAVFGQSLTFGASEGTVYTSLANGTISAKISGAAGLATFGPGTLTLAPKFASDYTGVTNINQGTVKLGATTGLGSTATGSGTVVKDGASLDLNGITVGAEALTLNGKGISAGGALANTGGALTYSGLLTLGSASSIVATGDIGLTNIGTINGAGFELTLDGSATASSIGSIIGTGTGGVTKTGIGTWSLTGLNSYTGVTTISGGVLSTGTSGILANGGTASSIGQSTSAATNLVLDGGTLRYANTGAAESTNRLLTLTNNGGTLDASGTNAITFASTGAIAYTGTGTRTLTLSGSGIGTFAPILANGSGGATSLTKSGIGTWSITGTNTYAGMTTISAGKLIITNASGSATGTGVVNLSGGITNTLSGTGFSSGVLTVTTASRLAPGINTKGGNGNFGVAGTLSLGTTGGMTLTNANLDFDLANSATTLGLGINDLIMTGGTLSLSSTEAFSFYELNGTLITGSAYTLISGATTANTGVVTSGWTTSFLNGATYTPTYSFKENDLQVTFAAVPEPRTAFLGAIGLLALLRRRR